MGRLGSSALERYQQLNKQLYSALDPHAAAGLSPPSPDPHTLGRDASGPQQAPTSSDTQVVVVRDGQSGLTHFGLVGSPSYPDIASDKGSYKSNSPKHIRRRHSDSSDNEDVAKAWQKAHKARDSQDSGPTQGTASAEGKPNSSAGPAHASSGEGGGGGGGGRPDAARKDQASDLSDSKAAAVKRKKTILKGENRRKSGNRVRFDPLALLLDASLEGELDLVTRTAREVSVGRVCMCIITL